MSFLILASQRPRVGVEVGYVCATIISPLSLTTRAESCLRALHSFLTPLWQRAVRQLRVNGGVNTRIQKGGRVEGRPKAAPSLKHVLEEERRSCRGGCAPLFRVRAARWRTAAAQRSLLREGAAPPRVGQKAYSKGRGGGGKGKVRVHQALRGCGGSVGTCVFGGASKTSKTRAEREHAPTRA